MSRAIDTLKQLPWKQIGEVLAAIAAVVAIITFVRELLPEKSPAPTPSATPITLVSLTSPISPKDEATLTIQVASGAVCDPGVIYKTGESEAQGLEPQTAGSDGKLSWTWRCGTTTTPGTYTVYVECDPGGRMDWPIVVQ